MSLSLLRFVAIMQRQVQAPLPIDPHLAEITAHVRGREAANNVSRTAVIVAPPGSGKTTRVTPRS